MNQETLETLFTPFERAPGDERAAGEEAQRGLGLGLAICKGIVDAHGGSIRATSEGPGRGAVFHVEFELLAPHLTADREAGGPERPSRTTAEPTAGGYRVLVVEDHEDTAEMLSMWLAHHGHTSDTAATLQRAAECAARAWDVIICDLGLPDGSGLDLARRVRSQDVQPRCLIAVSGYGSQADLDASREAGFDMHLTKPIDVQRLAGILESLGD
jgi:CheY-like chemotaxis protein